MDGRAKSDIESAAVYESLGRVKPNTKRLKREWGEMGAVLVRAPVTKDLPCGGSECGDFEVVSDIE
ncbi:hypothetical protein CIG19_16740 [Enterobacterales bacterium CwR94]|nr:hypothetical protein CIG19_16740 [Enterobacterales bacterium CwR94]